MTSGLLKGAAAVLAAALAVGCSSPLQPGPIRRTDPHVWSTVERTGSTFTDGMEVLYLTGVKPATLTSVELVGAEGLELVGVKLASPDRGFGSIQRMDWPPRDPDLPQDSVLPVKGTEITPIDPKDNTGTWELLIGIRVTGKGYLVRKAVRVNYTVGGEEYSRVQPAGLAVCTSRRLLVDGECPLPEGWEAWKGDGWDD